MKRLPDSILDCKNEKEQREWENILLLQHDLIKIQEAAEDFKLFAGEEKLDKRIYNNVEVLLELQLMGERLEELIDEYAKRPLYED